MKNKKIIGISSYAGSNTPLLIQQIKKLQPCYSYSLFELSPDEIVKKILRRKMEYSIIDGISSVAQIRWFEKQFKELAFKPILVKVPWEDCLKFMIAHNMIEWQGTPAEWRRGNEKDPYRLNILACEEYIGGHIYDYHDGCLYGAAGEIVDEMHRT